LNDIEELNCYNRSIKVDIQNLSIHHDIFGIMLKVSDLSDEQKEKMKVFWKSFLLPFFDIRKSIQLDLKFEIEIESGELKSIKEVELESKFPQISEQEKKDQKKVQIFYGNAPLFLFMRAYLIFYERLLHAKDLSNTEIPLNSDGEVFKQYEKNVNPSVAGDQDDQDEDDEDDEKDGKSEINKLKKEEVYPKFLSILTGYLDNSIDTLKYENDCQDLLGYQSFTFHTLDKLFALIQRQVRNLFCF
jgi:histone deacetylase complex regulatory component SIN3